MEFLLYLSKALRECDEMAPKRLAFKEPPESSGKRRRMMRTLSVTGGELP